MRTSRIMKTLRVLLLLISAGWAHGQTTNSTRPEFNCGGNLEADSGFVGSEGFPLYYKPNSKCTWYITVPEGNVVMLTFRFFDLEADTLCKFDFVDVHNGPSNMAQKLGRFCGTFRPGTLISTSNTMMLHMESDAATGGRGFVAQFTGVKPHLDEHRYCGGKMTKSQGTIKTPNWPEKNYPPGVSCSWLITVDPNMVVEVKFGKFDVEQDTYCRYDYVAFYNGGERDDSRRIGKYCGDKAPEPVVSSGNVLLVQFVSDQSVTSDGFMASYTSVPKKSSGSWMNPLPTNPEVDLTPPHKPISTINTEAPTTTTTTTEAPPKRQFRPSKNKPEAGRPNPAGREEKALCPKMCKRDGSIKSSFCSSEFVLTASVTSLSAGPQGRLLATVSIIKTYKAGRLTLTQVGENMSVKLLLHCRSCPALRRGQNYILMGQVDENGRGVLAPGSFTAAYKPPHNTILSNLNNQPCSSTA